MQTELLQFCNSINNCASNNINNNNNENNNNNNEYDNHNKENDEIKKKLSLFSCIVQVLVLPMFHAISILCGRQNITKQRKFAFIL